MLNWPGANLIVLVPFSGISSTVNVSSVSVRTWRIPYTSGRMGFVALRVDIQVEQLETRGLEPPLHD
ncbi:MAG: hypothetical protein ACM36C_07620, partial [Acidobacteriota bacterium]